MDDLTIVIQAGGKSTRMGQDKGLVPFRGKTLVEFIIAQVEGLPVKKFLISNYPEDYEFLGLPVFSDRIKDWGALGGIHTALFHLQTGACAILACDMPFISLPFLQYSYRMLADYDAVVPRMGEKRHAEPFRGLYRKSCLGPVETAIAAGGRRVISFFDAVQVRYIDEPEISRLDPTFKSFFNVNTRDDLERARKMAGEK